MKIVKFIISVAIIVAVVVFLTNKFKSLAQTGEVPVESPTPEAAEGQQKSDIDRGLAITKGPEHHIEFSTKDLDVNITKKKVAFAPDVEYLIKRVGDCGPDGRPKDYFNNLLASFSKTPTRMVYFIQDRHSTSSYEVSVIANAPGYKDLYSFKDDFFACEKGRIRPLLQSEAWLVFGKSCVEGDARCQDIAEVVEASIKIRQ